MDVEDEILDNETESEDSIISDEDQDELDDDEADLDDDEAGTSDEDDEESDDSDDSESDEWFVTGKFKTPQDMLQSYAQLERAYHHKSQEYAKLTKRPEKSVDPETRLKEFQELAKKDPLQAFKDLNKEELEELRGEVSEIRFERAYNERMANPEFKRLEPIMVQLVSEYQGAIEAHGLNKNPEFLDMLFEAAKGREREMSIKDAEKRGKKAGAKAARKKAKAKIEGASGSKGKSKINFDKLTSEEMEALINKGEISV